MLKTTMLVLTAVTLVGVSEIGGSYTDAQGTWQVATGERDNKGPPSSCPWKEKVDTRLAGGSATVVAHASPYEHSHPLEEKMRRNQQKTDTGVRRG